MAAAGPLKIRTLLKTLPGQLSYTLAAEIMNFNFEAPFMHPSNRQDAREGNMKQVKLINVLALPEIFVRGAPRSSHGPSANVSEVIPSTKFGRLPRDLPLVAGHTGGRAELVDSFFVFELVSHIFGVFASMAVADMS